MGIRTGEGVGVIELERRETEELVFIRDMLSDVNWAVDVVCQDSGGGRGGGGGGEGGGLGGGG